MKYLEAFVGLGTTSSTHIFNPNKTTASNCKLKPIAPKSLSNKKIVPGPTRIAGTHST